jgi:hypothetical protein
VYLLVAFGDLWVGVGVGVDFQAEKGSRRLRLWDGLRRGKQRAFGLCHSCGRGRGFERWPTGSPD